MVDGDDLAWLLELGATEWAAHAANLIRFVFDVTDVQQQELVWEHYGEPIFDDSVGHWFEAVALDSPEATRMRKEYAWSREPDLTWHGADTHETGLRSAWARCEQATRKGSWRCASACASIRPPVAKSQTTILRAGRAM